MEWKYNITENASEFVPQLVTKYRHQASLITFGVGGILATIGYVLVVLIRYFIPAVHPCQTHLEKTPRATRDKTLPVLDK